MSYELNGYAGRRGSLAHQLSILIINFERKKQSIHVHLKLLVYMASPIQFIYDFTIPYYTKLDQTISYSLTLLRKKNVITQTCFSIAPDRTDSK